MRRRLLERGALLAAPVKPPPVLAQPMWLSTSFMSIQHTNTLLTAGKQNDWDCLF